MRLPPLGYWIVSLSALAYLGCSSESTPTASNSEPAVMESSPEMEETATPDMPAESAPSVPTESSIAPGEEMSMVPGEEMSSSASAEMSPEMEMEMAMEAEMASGSAPAPEMTPSDMAMEAEMAAMGNSSGEPMIGAEGELFLGEGGPRSGQATAEPEPEPVPTDYLSQAKLAFAAGMEQRAHDLFLAHLVAEPELASQSQSYEMVGWSDATKRPTWGLRIGLGINTAAVKHSGDKHPVRADMKAPKEAVKGRPAAGGMAASGQENMEIGSGFEMESGMGAAMPAGASGSPIAEVDEYAGLVGEIALDLFSARFSEGDFSRVFATVTTTEADPAGASGKGGSRNAMGMEGSMGMESSMAMEVDGGANIIDVPVAPKESASAPLGLVDGPPRAAPGLVYLGAARPKELLEKARQEGLDAYLQIDVSVNKNEVNGWVYNDSSVRWMLVSTGKPVGRASKKINNKSVFQAMESRKLDPADMVREDLEGVFKGGLDDLRLKPLPSLTPAMVKARIGSLIMNSAERPLEALAEIRLYAAQKLITDEQEQLAFDLIMGDDGLILCAGPMEERVRLLEPKTPKLTAIP